MQRQYPPLDAPDGLERSGSACERNELLLLNGNESVLSRELLSCMMRVLPGSRLPSSLSREPALLWALGLSRDASGGPSAILPSFSWCCANGGR